MSRRTEIARTAGHAIPTGAVPRCGYRRRQIRLSHTKQNWRQGYE
jgi:hypothetical protein